MRDNKPLTREQAHRLVRPLRPPAPPTIYVPQNKLLECRCVHGCVVKFAVVPYVATPKAFGECEHFRYVMLLNEETPASQE